MPTLYMTPLGYTNRRPVGLPSIDRGALMRCRPPGRQADAFQFRQLS